MIGLQIEDLDIADEAVVNGSKIQRRARSGPSGSYPCRYRRRTVQRSRPCQNPPRRTARYRCQTTIVAVQALATAQDIVISAAVQHVVASLRTNGRYQRHRSTCRRHLRRSTCRRHLRRSRYSAVVTGHDVVAAVAGTVDVTAAVSVGFSTLLTWELASEKLMLLSTVSLPVPPLIVSVPLEELMTKVSFAVAAVPGYRHRCRHPVGRCRHRRSGCRCLPDPTARCRRCCR